MRHSLAISLLLCAPLCRAQDIRFQRITERDGLAHHLVHAVHRDRHGLIWAATEGGLNNWNGARAELFGTDHGFPSQAVTDIAEDSAGIFWLGTRKGLVRFDPVTRASRSWPLDSVTDPVLGASIVRVAALSTGEVVCTGEHTVQVFDPRTERWAILRAPTGEALDPYSRLLLPDSGATGCWISTNNHNLVYYRSPTRTLLGAFHDPGSSPLLNGIRASAMVRTPQGDRWLYDDLRLELCRFRQADGTIERWQHLPGHPEKRLRIGVTAMHLDARGRIWASGWADDPFVFDPSDSSVVTLRMDDHDPGSIGSSLFNEIIADPKGRLWIPTFGGLCVYDSAELPLRTSRPTMRLGVPVSLELYTAVFEGDSVLWHGTENGLVRHDLKREAYRMVQLGPGPGPWNSVLDMVKADGRFWMATRAGIWTFDPRTERAVRFTGFASAEKAMESAVFGWIVRGKDGALWFGMWHAGLVRLDPRTGAARWFRTNGPEGLPSGPFHCALATTDGALWIGHGVEGLIQFQPSTGWFTRFNKDFESGKLVNGRILGLAEDQLGHLWIGTDGSGLIRYDRATSTYKVYDRSHGLRDLTIEAIRPDAKGRVWVGTRVGLCWFDPVKERFTHVATDYGKPFNDLLGHSMQLEDGQLYFTNGASAFWFHPERYTPQEAPPAPIVSHLYLDGALTPLEGDSVVRMRYDQQLLAIHYGVVSPPGTIIAYAMRQAGGSWDHSTEGMVNIQGLRPGEHLFELKVLGREGLWSEVKRLRIIMPPPWWQWLWVRVLVALLLALAIVLFFRLRLNMIRRRERKEEGFARAMDELRLRALRAQMDPHFIFNCLNSIDKYILMEQGEKASRYLNRFARLVRLILDQSDSVRVPVEKEAELLRYYIELECLRFKHPFAWEVKVDPELLLAEAELPTMLVQPYVENAIWHGLQHKPGAGRLTVEFRKLGQEMECVVEDDGIGREASARINAERHRIHQSKSMQVNADRLRLLEGTEHRLARTEITDLKDRDGQALGTRVRILLPIDQHEP